MTNDRDGRRRDRDRTIARRSARTAKYAERGTGYRDRIGRRDRAVVVLYLFGLFGLPIMSALIQ